MHVFLVIVIELMFLGISMFLALLRAHFNPRYARAKMVLSRAKNIFMPANVNSIVPEPTARSAVPGVSPGRGY